MESARLESARLESAPVEAAASERKEVDSVESSGPILTEAQLAEAASKLIFNFPTVVRKMRDPPLAGQAYVVFTILNRKEPKVLASGKKIYAYIKVSGVTATVEEADTLAKKILNEVHSRFPVRIGEVGAFHPISDDVSLAKDVLAMATAGDMGGGAAGDKHLYDETAEATRKEDTKKIQELRDRAAELEKSGDTYDDPGSLRFYAMKRNSEKFLTENIEAMRSKLNKMMESRKKVWGDCRAIETIHPEYTEALVNEEGIHAPSWVHYYNGVRAESGLPAWIPSATQFAEYQAFVPEKEPVFDADALRGFKLSDIPEGDFDRIRRLRKEGKVVDATPPSSLLHGGGAADA